VLVAPVLLAAVVAPVAAATAWAWRGADQPLRRASAAALPAVAADAAAGPLGSRTLVLGRAGDAVTYRLQGSEPEAWTRDLPGREPRARGGDASDVVAKAVAGLLAPQAPATDGADPVAAVGRLGVGFVLVAEPVPADTAERLDSLGGLTRIGAPRGSRLWRVGAAQDPAAARVRLVDGRGDPVAAVPVSGAHAAIDTTLPAGPGDRRVVLSEVASTHWRATLDGHRLRAVAGSDDGAWRQAFDVPAAGGHLVVRYVDPVIRGWHQAQLALAALVALLALPVRRPGERP
jgi:hypothetical protein